MNVFIITVIEFGLYTLDLIALPFVWLLDLEETNYRE